MALMVGYGGTMIPPGIMIIPGIMIMGIKARASTKKWEWVLDRNDSLFKREVIRMMEDN
jgi:hypothetical protein